MDGTSNGPWHLTIVSTQGIQYLRPEKSWRPIVSVTVVDSGHQSTHETVLGCDGRNPNLKVPITIDELYPSSQLDIKVWHKAHTKKSRRKRYLVGSVTTTVREVLKRQEDLHPGNHVSLALACPPAQKRSPTIKGARQLNSASLVIRLRQHSLSWSSIITTDTLVDLTTDDDSAAQDRQDGDIHSFGSPPDSPLVSTGSWDGSRLRPRTLRRRRKSSSIVKPYFVNTTDEEEYDESSQSDPESLLLHHSSSGDNISHFEPGPFEDFPVDLHLDEWYTPHSLPEPIHRTVAMTRAEAFVNAFSPYREMCHSQCDFHRVLSRLLTEWYAVGASLLGTAALNAAVFGYASGGGTLFEIDGLALRSVTIGSIAAGIGIVVDAWFLMLYSSGDVDRFQRIAADVDKTYGHTYFYFSLTCRLPTLCLFISAFTLMLFLLSVAWSAWPSAVLVMCCAAGALLTLQYLVYGVSHLGRGFARLINALISMAMRSRNQLRRSKSASKITIPSLDFGAASPPPPYSSPPAVSVELSECPAPSTPTSDILQPNFSRIDDT